MSVTQKTMQNHCIALRWDESFNFINAWYKELQTVKMANNCYSLIKKKPGK